MRTSQLPRRWLRVKRLFVLQVDISSYSVDAGDKKKAGCVQAAFEGLDLMV